MNMSKVNEKEGDIQLFSSRDEPAVGLVVSGESTEWVAAEIINARRHGHQVLVIGTDYRNSRWKVYAKALDAIVIEEENDLLGNQSARERLTESAREMGFPGLIVHDNPVSRIDFDASIQVLLSTDLYVVEARASSPVEESTTLLAGIPAYNEESIIRSVIEETSQYVDQIIVVDDGSDDDTAAEAKRAGALVVEHETNRGYGAALQTIFEHAEFAGVDHLVILDGDGQHEPADIPKMIDAQDSDGAHLIIGSRFVEDGETNAPLYRRLGLFLINTLTNLSFGIIRPRSWIKDTQSGFRLYSREAVGNLTEDPNISDGMSASTDILHHAHRKDYQIREVGASVDYDIDATSTRHPVSHGMRLLKNILRTAETDRPITVLGIPGFVCWFAGLWFAYWTITEYISTETFSLGLGIVSGFLSLTGVLTCFTAIILHALSTHHN